MSCREIHSGDFGTMFLATVKDCGTVVPLSGATTLEMRFRLPGYPAASLVKTASLYSDGSDGKMQYTTASGDIDTVGTWQVQGYIETTGGAWYSSIESFKVIPNL